MNTLGMEENVATEVLSAMANFNLENDRCTIMSRQSYAAFQGFKATVMGRIFDALCACGDGGATDDEIEEALGLLHQTVNPCRLLLHKEGWITQNGQVRNTRSGRSAVVWVACKERIVLAAVPKTEGWAIRHDGKLTGEIFTSEADAITFVENLHDDKYVSEVEIIKMREVRNPKYVQTA